MVHYPNPIPLWKVAPFTRLIIPFIIGILAGWYFKPAPWIIVSGNLFFLLAWFLFKFFELSSRFKLHFVQGLIVSGLVMGFGCLLTWQKDIRNNNTWFGKYYHDSDYLVVKINEPMIEKAKSYKADGVIEAIIQGDTIIRCEGKILLYFSRDSSMFPLKYGDVIVIQKPLQKIKNSGNPGAFNYERYAGFQSIFHNVFLKDKDWVPTGTRHINRMQRFIFTARDNILKILRGSVTSGKDELGIAQALLIGYTNDLDKDLVQAYSNTGVVHIIAISGMHLGLIYIMLVWIFAKIPLVNKSKILQVILILLCLWFFSLVTGASASVVRAAVMFTFIAFGKTFQKNSSIYNSLAASAFVMLCFNPYFLWDVGFQLSYLAVVGIILFQKPVYNWFYIKNKWPDKLWKLAAISIAAQLLTFPVCIYYFHQFPNLFLLTNIVAVPLSSIILYAEIGLVCVSSIPVLGLYAGKLVGLLVGIMNGFILWMNHFSFAVWDKIPSTVFSTLLLYAFVIFTAAWLLNSNKHLLKWSLVSLFFLASVNAYSKWQISTQQKLIVYNVPQHRAVDVISGSNYHFVGDSILRADGMLQNFHLKPGRIALQLNQLADTLDNCFGDRSFMLFHHKKILLIGKVFNMTASTTRMDMDVIVISHNPKLTMARLNEIFNCNCYVFDASNSLWKIVKWQKECEELHLRSYSVSDSGAYVMNIR